MMILEVYVSSSPRSRVHGDLAGAAPAAHAAHGRDQRISGISLVGSIIMAGAQHSRLATILGFIAVVCATTNIVGGFLIVDRMLRCSSGPTSARSRELAEASAGRRSCHLDSVPCSLFPVPCRN